MANDYATLTSRLASELLSNLSTKYTGLVVSRQIFKPDALPANFTKYGLVISPNPRPWDERRIAVREIQYIYRVDLFCLVANYDDTNSLFGVTPSSDLGLFELVQDVKNYLRTSNLSGLLDKTYDEPGGDASKGGGGGVEFQELATTGLSAGTFAHVQRAKIPFVARTAPFCHAKAT